MKQKIFVAVLALMTAVGAIAQNSSRWGIVAGANYNTIDFSQGEIFDSDPLFCPTAGVTGEMMFPGIGFGVDAGLRYTMRSGKLHLGQKWAWASQGYGDENVMIHYVEVPLHLKFKYHDLNGFENKIMPLVYAGPSFNFHVAHNDAGDALSYKRINVTLDAGIGCELFNKVQINLGYSFSVSQGLRTKLLDRHTARHKAFMGTVAYFF